MNTQVGNAAGMASSNASSANTQRPLRGDVTQRISVSITFASNGFYAEISHSGPGPNVHFINRHLDGLLDLIKAHIVAERLVE